MASLVAISLLLLLCHSCIATVSPPPNSATSTVMTLTVTIPKQQRALTPIPAKFMGLSHTWAEMATLAGSATYLNMLKNLVAYSGGPFVIRIGGNSADSQNTTVPPETWQGLNTLYTAIGVKYILGLNLMIQNTTLALEQVLLAKQYLPKQAIMSWEIGNEPDLFNKHDPANYPPNYATSPLFTKDFKSYAQALAPLLNATYGTTQLLAGPVLASLDAWQPSDIASFTAATRRSLGMLTAHQYALPPGTSLVPTDLLTNDVIEPFVKGVESWVLGAQAARIPFRVDEINSVFDGGQPGVSNTFAAALWTLQASVALAKAGVNGINLSGGTCAAYSIAYIQAPAYCATKGAALAALALQYNQSGFPQVFPQAQYYGVLAAQIFLGAGQNGTASFLKVNLTQAGAPLLDNAAVVAYALTASAGLGLSSSLNKTSGANKVPIRVLVLNKAYNGSALAFNAASVTIKVKLPGKARGPAQLYLLQSSQGYAASIQLSSQVITLAGQQLDIKTGLLTGPLKPTKVKGVATGNGDGTMYQLTVAPGQAVILQA